MHKTILTMAAVVLIASATQAGVIAQFVIDEPVLVGMPGWQGVVLRLISTSGNFMGVDFGGTPGDHGRGVFIGMHQQWSAALDGNGEVIPDSWNPTIEGNPGATTATSRDSFWTNQLIEAGVFVKSEDNNLANGPNPPWDRSPLSDSAAYNNGVGSVMHYITGIQRSSQAAALDLAYLVIPGSGGTVGDVTADSIPRSGPVLARAAVATIGSQYFEFEVTWVPEPSTVAVLSFLCAVGLRRRMRWA
jgi:hypothetical protein